MKMNKKMKLGLITGATLLVGLGGVAVRDFSVEAENNKNLVKAEQELIKLYDKDMTFLLKSNSDTNKVLKEVKVSRANLKDKILFSTSKSKDNEKLDKFVSDTINITEQKVRSQDILYSAFEKEFILENSEKMKDKLKDLTVADVHFQSVNKMKESPIKKDSEYNKTYNLIRNYAKEEVSKISEAKEELERIVKDDEVVSTDKKVIDAAKEKIEQVSNESLKEEYHNQWQKANEKWEKEEKERKEKERQEKERQEKERQAQQQKQQTQVATNSGGQQSKPQTNQGGGGSAQPQQQQAPKPAPTPAQWAINGTPVAYGGSTSAMGGFNASTPLLSWTGASQWYLAERIAPAGGLAHSLSIGSPVTLNGVTYRVIDIDYNIINGSADVGRVLDKHASYGGPALQTCETASPTSPLRVYHLG